MNMRCMQDVNVRRVGLCICDGRFCEYEVSGFSFLVNDEQVWLNER